MPYDARVVKVMIASPGDVSTERQIVREVLQEWNAIHSEDRALVLLPIGWDTHSTPELGDRPQAIINNQILADCDLLVAIFWTRIGTATGNAVSGTVEEIDEHVNVGKPAMLYFSSAPVRPDSVVEEQYRALKAFKQRCLDRGLVETYESVGEFRDKFFRQLSQKIIRYFPTAATSESQSDEVFPERPGPPELGELAKTLLLEAADDRNGVVMRVLHLGGLAVQTNGKQFCETGNARDEARCEAAISELADLELIEDRGYKGEIYNVTDEGYRVADLLRAGG
jgi:hypothetical protein